MSGAQPDARRMESELDLLRHRVAALECERVSLARMTRLHTLATRFLERVAGGAPLAELLQMLVEAIEAVQPEMIGSVLLMDEDGVHLRHGAAPSLPDFYNRAVDGLAIGPAVGSCGTCAYTGERIIVENLATHPYWSAFKDVALRAGVRACWSHPITSPTGRIIGTFAMYYREPRRPTTQDLELITFAAHLGGIAIERTRTEGQLRARERQYRALFESAPVCIHEIDLEGRITSMNPAGLSMLGLTRMADVIGERYLDCVAPVDQELVETLVHRCVGGEPVAFEFRGQPGGATREIAASLAPIRNDQGTVVKLMGVAQDVTDRKDTERRRALMVRELDHRVKNTLASVLSLTEQMLHRAHSLEEFGPAFIGRVRSMAVAHELLAEGHWEGVELGQLLEHLLDPFRREEACRITLNGPPVNLPAEVAPPICMVLHELATNAVKYGSLSTMRGRVCVTWNCQRGSDGSRALCLTWAEAGGPPVSAPTCSGRGISLIEHMISYQLEGETNLRFEPEGVRCTVNVPLKRSAPTAVA